MATRELKDRIGKRLFRDRRFVADLLRGFLPAELVGDLDLATLREAPAEFIDRRGHRRLGDALWLVDRRDGRPVLVLVEIQSTDDPRMAARLTTETGLLYESLPRHLADGRYPALLPLVVHVGRRPWRSAADLAARLAAGDPLAAFVAGPRFALLDLARLRRDDLPERNRAAAFARIHGGPTALAVVRELRDALGWLGGDERELREALGDWVSAVVVPERFPEEVLRALAGLEEEMSMSMLEENVKEWTETWRQEGLDQGLAHERSLLRRQASRRFGAAAGERLAAVLAEVSDPARLEEAGDLIVDCATGEELLGRLNGAG